MRDAPDTAPDASDAHVAPRTSPMPRAAAPPAAARGPAGGVLTASDRSRRAFLARAAAIGAAGAASTTAARPAAAQVGSAASDAMKQPGGGDDAAADPADLPLTAEDVRAASRVLDLRLTDAEIELMLGELERRRRTLPGRRTPAHPNDVAPAEVFRPLGLQSVCGRAARRSVRPIDVDPGPRPRDPRLVAHRPVTHLAAWLRDGTLTSRRLTELFLERIERLDGRLAAVITATPALALEQADRADAELAAGSDRGPLHGIPYGAKDLFDTAGIRTTWGATPFAERVPDRDAAVVRRLADAGAVLVAKTTLGALAYGDRWFGGRTNSPWDVERGSSGSSAGSASGVAAGLFAFGLGTETYGSIVSPSMRCGTTGLRPTFGRVPRTGAMALCWSLDKVGPICRTVEDCGLVLAAIDGADAGDPSSLELDLDVDPARSLADLVVGIDPAWFAGRRANPIDAAALRAMRRVAARPGGPRLVEIEGPSPAGAGQLLTILEVEAAAAFQDLTLSGADDRLQWQGAAAWPNTFRAAHFHSAVDLLQAQRRRRIVAERLDAAFAEVDAILAPSFAGGLNLMTNFTGHPCLVLRAGFDADGQPRGVSLFGRLGADDRLVELGVRLERELGVWSRMPTGF